MPPAKKIDTTTRRVDLGNWNKRHEPRIGVMLHYDASASDAGAVAWMLRDPACKVSYNWLILDDGTVVPVAPADARAWHAGVCKASNPAQMFYKDANSAFYGIAVAAGSKDLATPAQRAAVAKLCAKLMRTHRWADDWRLTSHALEAWPRGRKADIGKVYPIEEIRADVMALLKTENSR